jgi:hypothetical protein
MSIQSFLEPTPLLSGQRKDGRSGKKERNRPSRCTHVQKHFCLNWISEAQIDSLPGEFATKGVF